MAPLPSAYFSIYFACYLKELLFHSIMIALLQNLQAGRPDTSEAECQSDQLIGSATEWLRHIVNVEGSFLETMSQEKHKAYDVNIVIESLPAIL